MRAPKTIDSYVILVAALLALQSACTSGLFEIEPQIKIEHPDSLIAGEVLEIEILFKNLSAEEIVVESIAVDAGVFDSGRAQLLEVKPIYLESSYQPEGPTVTFHYNRTLVPRDVLLVSIEMIPKSPGALSVPFEAIVRGRPPEQLVATLVVESP